MAEDTATSDSVHPFLEGVTYAGRKKHGASQVNAPSNSGFPVRVGNIVFVNTETGWSASDDGNFHTCTETVTKRQSTRYLTRELTHKGITHTHPTKQPINLG